MPFSSFASVNKTRLAIYFLILANVIWGAAPPVFKWSLENIDVSTLAFLRFAVAALLVLPFAVKKLRVEPKDILSLIILSFLGISINITFFLYGLNYAPSINASIIASAAPILLIPASFFFLKERPKKRVIFGTILGLIGVIIILIKPFLTNGGTEGLVLLGNMFFVVATLGAVGHTVFSKKIMDKYAPITICFWSFVIGSLTFLPQFIYSVEKHGFLPNLNYQGIIGLFFGIIFCSVIAYYFYYFALKYITACEVGVFVYLDPIVTILIAMPLLKEFPDFYYLLGSLLVFSGIYFAKNRLQYHPFKLLKKVIPEEILP